MMDERDSDQGSFLTGLVLGMCMGATGYFLFGTDKGHDVRTKLLEEWEDAKERLASEGTIAHKQVSLREFASDLVERATGVSMRIAQSLTTPAVHHAPHRRPTPKSSPSKSPSGAARKVATPAKFKGV